MKCRMLAVRLVLFCFLIFKNFKVFVFKCVEVSSWNKSGILGKYSKWMSGKDKA